MLDVQVGLGGKAKPSLPVVSRAMSVITADRVSALRQVLSQDVISAGT